MRLNVHLTLAASGLLVATNLACSEGAGSDASAGAGGELASGGSTGGSLVGGGGLPQGTGNSTAAGGVGGASSGGQTSNGGTQSTGGNPAGGAGGSGGGATTGGSESGGNAAGGAPSGGASSGGSSSGGSSSGGAGDTESGGSGGGGTEEGPTLPPISDYSERGPFDTVVESDVGPGEAYTIFRPETLGQDDFLHAPIVFGPGIGQSVNVHTAMLTNFASHGFIVVGTPVLGGGPGDAGNRQKMQDGLDWIVGQNEQPGIYEGVVWTDHAVSMGFSVGGTAAVEIGGDPAVLTVVSIHGHTATATLHGTMLQTTGTGDTVGMPLQQQTYDNSQVPTFLATLTGASHGYIEQDAGGEERPAIVAWMRYWIYGDEGAEDYFFGPTCTLCTSPWENPQRKNWD